MTTGPDRLLISGIDCVARIGVTPEERTMKQRLSVDVEMSTDVRRAAASDALSDALDYSTIVPEIGRLAGSREFHLIETIAERIAERIIADFGVETVRVVVRKTPVLSSPVHHVAVEIVRSAPPLNNS